MESCCGEVCMGVDYGLLLLGSYEMPIGGAVQPIEQLD